MKLLSRRNFIKTGAAGSLGMLVSGRANASGIPETSPVIQVRNPLNRKPVSLIIDDSTALVNLAYYGIPQFKEVFPAQYLQDWTRLPREIPDDFVREFGDWCKAKGIKGKYSMVPYPACTGWLHRFIPGWTEKQLRESLALVRDFMQPDWDIHPELISHTRVINIKTGLPFPETTPNFMENWEWSQDKSADELGSYIAYALNILKEAGLTCEGMTTPGGFGSRNMENLALGTQQAVQEVYHTGLSHFFRDVITDPAKSVEPQLFHVSGLESGDPKCAVHIIACTDDWFGGWDGLTPGNPDLLITPDLQKGRLPEVLDRGEPAIIACHWPGLYFNGDKTGFNIFKEVVKRLERKYNDLVWMKVSDIARYWAAKKLTRIESNGKQVVIKAPFATSRFTLSISSACKAVKLISSGGQTDFKKETDIFKLDVNTFVPGRKESMICFDLPQGESSLEIYR